MRLAEIKLDILRVVAIVGQNSRSGGKQISIFFVQADLNGELVIGRKYAHLHRSTVIFKKRCNEIIGNVLHGSVQQINIAEDTSHTELVLIFQIASVTPLQDKHCQLIGAFLQFFRHIKFTGGVTNVTTIEPDIEAGINTLKVQVNHRSRFIKVELKLADISATRILMRNIRRIKRERVLNIGVLVVIVSVHLPYAGNGHGIKIAGIIFSSVKAVLEIVDAFIVTELPLAVEKLHTIGLSAGFQGMNHHLRCRDVV